jgi:hypothetical protein
VGPAGSMALDSAHSEVILISSHNRNAHMVTFPLSFRLTDSSGSPTTRAIDLPYTDIPSRAVAVDSQNGELYAIAPDLVSVFSRTDTGKAVAKRTLTGTTAYLGNAKLSVDAARGEVFVATGDTVRAFPVDADGQAEPLRTIKGPSTLLGVIADVKVDPLNHELFVSSKASNGEARILVFAEDTSGDVAPLREIKTRTSGTLAVDLGNDELMIALFDGPLGGGPFGVGVYARDSQGAAQLKRVPPVHFQYRYWPRTFAFDARNDHLLVEFRHTRMGLAENQEIYPYAVRLNNRDNIRRALAELLGHRCLRRRLPAEQADPRDCGRQCCVDRQPMRPIASLAPGGRRLRGT